MNTHEISMQSAVMSGLADVNSSQLYVALTRGRYENLCVQVYNPFYEEMLFKDDGTQKMLLSKNY